MRREPICPWCWLRQRGRMFVFGHHVYDRLWAAWRRQWWCSRCSPPIGSRAGRLAQAHNALMTEIRQLRDDIVATASAEPQGGKGSMRSATTDEPCQTAVRGIGAAAYRASRATTETEVQSAMAALRLKIRLLEIRVLAALEDARTVQEP